MLAHDFGFAFGIGDSNHELGGDVATDSANNSYLVGSFQGTIDADPGAGTTNLTSAGSWDTVIAKYDPSGAMVWAHRIGGTGDDRGMSLAVDGSGNVLVHGRFDGAMDLDPGAGTFNVATAGGLDAFVLKLDTNGNFQWGGTQGGTGSDAASFSSIAVDAVGDVYTTGLFTDTPGVDLDPGAGTFAPVVNGGGSLDVFVTKIDGATGDLIWGAGVGGTSPDQGHAIAVSDTGDVLVAGTFFGTIDLDPGVGTDIAISNGAEDMFVQKLDTNGNFQWAKAFGSNVLDDIYDVAVDSGGNVYSSGTFGSTVDFDPGPGVTNITSVGFRDAFVSKLDSSGNFQWAHGIGSSSGFDNAGELAVDALDNIVIAGNFRDTIDFDPGPGTSNLTSAGLDDIFVWQLDSSGALLDAKSMGGTAVDAPSGVALDTVGNIYTTGQFQGTADFDPDSIDTFNLASNGLIDLFLSKLLAPTGPNTAPEITSLAVNQAMIFENGSVTLDGDFTDPDLGDEHTVTIDWGDGTIQVETLTIGARDFDFAHQYLDDGSSPGNNTSQDDYTIEVTISDGNGTVPDLLVASHASDEVLRYDGTTGAFIDEFVSPGEGGMDGPTDMVLGPDGNVYVTSTLTDEVLRYDASGNFIDVFVTAGSGGLDAPNGIAFGPDGNFYASSFSPTTHAVRRYDGTTGAFIDVFVSEQSGGLFGAGGITFGPDGNLYVSSNPNTPNDAVLRYDGTTGAFIDVFGSVGTAGTGPGILFGPDNNLYVTTPHTQQIRQSNGTTAGTLSVFANASGPSDLLFGDDGNLYVAGAGFNKVTRHDGTTGAFIDEFVTPGSGGLSNAHALLFVEVPETETVNVTVKNVAPVFDAGPNESLPAGSDSLNRPGITFTDPGTLDVHTVKVDYDGDAIIDQTINVALGVRTFDLNHTYTSGGVYTVSVTVEDDDTGSLTDTFDVTVVLNTPPTTSGIANVNVLEDAPNTVIDLFAAFDDAEDADNALTYTVEMNTETVLIPSTVINGMAGTLTLAYAPDENGTADIKVRATDSGGLFVESTFTVNVADVNDEPSFTMQGNQTVTEDSGAHVVPGFAAAAPGGGSDESSQTFTYNVSVNDPSLFTVQPTIDANGQLTYTLQDDANGTANVMVSVTDSGGTANGGVETSPVQTFQITILSAEQQTQQLVDDVQDLKDAGVLNNGQANPAINFLNQALKDLDKGKESQAIKKLNDFIDRIEDLINDGTLTFLEGQPLIDIANAAIQSAM